MRRIKRVIDLTFALVAIVFLAPIILVLSLVIRRRMGKPVIFRQKRLGEERKVFSVFKFRTMIDAVGTDGRLLPDGDRLTPLGIWLRRTSLDELPQLWNVIRGDISLVGPRPMPIGYGPYFKQSEEIRFSVPPGITGWAQIHGRNEATWDDRFSRDVWYVENWSLKLDFLILFKTIGSVLKRKGVVVDARSIMLNLDEERSYMVNSPTLASDVRRN